MSNTATIIWMILIAGGLVAFVFYRKKQGTKRSGGRQKPPTGGPNDRLR